jgi:ABC-type transport system involved in cytochrome c biogenesis permease component
MNLLPLVERELRLGARARGLHWLRASAAVGATLLGSVLLLNSDALNPATGLGARGLFMALVGLAFAVCLLSGPLFGADCLAAERRSGTLDLIFLTGIHGPAIVAAKFVALTFPALHLLLATLPVMALAFFIGGVTGEEFVRVAGALLNTLFLSLGVTLACSSVLRDGARALACSLGVLLGLNVALPAAELAWWQHAFPNTAPELQLPSPAYALLLSSEAWSPANRAGYWPAIVRGQVLGWSTLLGAAVLLPGIWRRSLHRPTFLAGCHAWRFARRAAARLRDEPPLLWLARRQTSHALGPWLFVLLSCPALLAVAWLTRQSTLPWLSDLFLLSALGLVLKLWIAWSASRGFADDRESGALELLLVAPLDQRDLWRARLVVLKRQFLGAVLTLVLTMFFMLCLGTDRSQSAEDYLIWQGSLLAGIVLLLADAYALVWVGLWQGLTARSTTRACVRTIVWIIIVPTAVLFVLGALLASLSTDSGTFAVLLLVASFVVGMLTDVAACVLAMLWVSDRFRGAAAADYQPGRR